MKTSNEPHEHVEYESLPASPDGSRPRPKLRREHSSLVSFGAGCLVTALLTAIGMLIARHPELLAAKSAADIEAEDWNYCGRSSKAAMERGCVMEPLFYGWFPPQCVYPELTAQFPVFEDRTFYADINMTRPLRPEQLWAGEFAKVYTKRYHGEHCLFQWRKMQYAMDHRMEFLDNKTISVHHSKHCADQLSVGCEGPLDVNDIDLGFYRCRKTIW